MASFVATESLVGGEGFSTDGAGVDEVVVVEWWGWSTDVAAAGGEREEAEREVLVRRGFSRELLVEVAAVPGALALGGGELGGRFVVVVVWHGG